MATEIPAALRTPGYQPHEIASTIIRNLKNSLSEEWKNVDIYTHEDKRSKIPYIALDVGDMKHTGSSWYYLMCVKLFNCPDTIDSGKVMSLTDDSSLLSSILNLSIGGEFFSPNSISKFVPSDTRNSKANISSKNMELHGRIEIPVMKPESEVTAIDIPETMLPEDDNRSRLCLGIAEDKTERYVLEGYEGDETHLFISGTSGSGKTTMLCNIAKQIIEIDPECRVVYADISLRKPPEKLHKNAIFINSVAALHAEISEIAKFHKQYIDEIAKEDANPRSSFLDDIEVNEIYDNGVIILLDSVWNALSGIPSDMRTDMRETIEQGRQIFSWIWSMVASREEVPVSIIISEQKIDYKMPTDYQHVILLGQTSHTARVKVLKDDRSLDYLYKTRRNDGTRFGERPGEGILRHANTKKIVPFRAYNI